MKVPTSGRLVPLLGALVLGFLATPQAVIAQAASVAPTVAAVQAAPAALDGPRIATAGVSNVVATSVTLPPLVPLQDDLRHNGTDIAMMVVGGAAIVVGAVVGGEGGTMISVAGAVVGLIGLFRYLR